MGPASAPESRESGDALSALRDGALEVSARNLSGKVQVWLTPDELSELHKMLEVC